MFIFLKETNLSQLMLCKYRELVSWHVFGVSMIPFELSLVRKLGSLYLSPIRFCDFFLH